MSCCLGALSHALLVPGVALRDAEDAAGMNKHLVIHPKRDCGKRPWSGGEGMSSPRRNVALE